MGTSDHDFWGWDTERMRGLYKGRPAAKAVVDALAGSGEDVEFTTVDDVIATAKCERPVAIDVLQNFVMCRCGKFVVGRRGYPSRLVWRYGLTKALAREVVGKVDSVPPADDSSPEPKKVDSVPPADDSSPEPQFVEQPIWLRPGVQVAVRFPVDMTQEEAEKVAGVVRNLWFGPGKGKE